MTDPNNTPSAELNEKQQKQLEELMTKADLVEQKEAVKEPELVFDEATDLDMITNPDVIGDGVSPQMFNNLMNQYAVPPKDMERRYHPTKKYVTRAERVKKRKIAKASRKRNRGVKENFKRAVPMGRNRVA